MVFFSLFVNFCLHFLEGPAWARPKPGIRAVLPGFRTIITFFLLALHLVAWSPC